MKIAFMVSAPYAGDRLFADTGPLNRDDCLAGYRRVRDVLHAAGHHCHTGDHYRQAGESPDVAIFLEIPRRAVRDELKGWNAEPWVILFESEVVVARNWHLTRHREFERVYTWRDDLVDERRYFKINFSNSIMSFQPNREFEQQNLLTMIVGNKHSRHPLELYSERRELIRYFRRYHPGEFEYFGVGWDRTRLSRAPFLSALGRRWPTQRPDSWGGMVDAKAETFRKYRFAVCYENARDIPGYVTEKLFDAMLAGTVPIYRGADNITDHIPADCFIDRRDFNSNESLRNALVAMPESERRSYLVAAERYLRSAAAVPFDHSWFAKQLTAPILKGKACDQRNPVPLP